MKVQLLMNNLKKLDSCKREFKIWRVFYSQFVSI